MSNKLKPCPFCGSKKVNLWQEFDVVYVVCVDCQADGPRCYFSQFFPKYNAKEEAALLWNERAGDGAQPEIEYPTFSADGSKLFVIENGEVKEYSLGEDYKRLFGEEGSTDEV